MTNNRINGNDPLFDSDDCPVCNPKPLTKEEFETEVTELLESEANRG